MTRRWLDEQLLDHLVREGRVRNMDGTAVPGATPSKAPAVDEAAAPTVDRRRIKSTAVIDEETGRRVDSKHEAKVLRKQRERLRHGDIDLLATQVWVRVEGGRVELDFVMGRIVSIDGVPHLRIEACDAKPQGGLRTDRWTIRRRQLQERYGLTVTEL